MHMNSEKFVTPGKGDAHLDTMDTQADSTETEIDSMDKLVSTYVNCLCVFSKWKCIYLFKKGVGILQNKEST